MLLYRARTVSSRPGRLRDFIDNTAGSRVKGRWFTSDLASAIAHRKTLAGETEIVCLDVNPVFAKHYQVASHPVTECGIPAGEYSKCPETDYILPAFMVAEAEVIEAEGDVRKRDYIDIANVTLCAEILKAA
jgi:hypothetical protein